MLQLINHLGLSASKFADEMGIQRSGISHILSGRNQPSFDFLIKLMNKYPDINLEWFITGQGEMKKSAIRETAQKEVHQKSPKVTQVNNIEHVILVFTDGTFKHYDPARQD